MVSTHTYTRYLKSSIFSLFNSFIFFSCAISQLAFSVGSLQNSASPAMLKSTQKIVNLEQTFLLTKFIIIKDDIANYRRCCLFLREKKRLRRICTSHIMGWEVYVQALLDYGV
jgi:hypothetical protein